MKHAKLKILDPLNEVVDFEVEKNDLEVPDSSRGDLAFPCMEVAAKEDRNPREVAEEIKQDFESSFVEKIDVAGPGYLNFYLKDEEFFELIQEVINSENMGVEQKKGEVLVEFSSPNIAKPMHIGHVRNNCIGDSLQRIMRFADYNVTSENYLGDWGSQFGKAIASFKNFGSEEELDENPMDHIYNLYVKYHEEAEKDSELEEEAAEWSKKIEEGDEEARKLWKKLREITIKYNEQDYERMNIEFDRITGESKVVDKSEEILEKGLEKGIFKEDDDGSIYVDFEDDGLPNTVVKKADGTTLYLTRDIANIEKRVKEGFDKNIYVVGSEQDLHFEQLFKISEEFGFTEIENEHVSYGLLDLGEESMSSREGNIITLSDLLDEAKEKAEERIEDRENIDKAEEISLGAIKYANLSVSRNKDIEFDWEEVLTFEGESGPYLQYSNTRAKSILEKVDIEGNVKGDLSSKERMLLRKISMFSEKVDDAVENREPAKIANYLSDLCEEFNRFYHNCPVLEAEKQVRVKRVKLIELFVEVSDQGLELLGIKPLQNM